MAETSPPRLNKLPFWIADVVLLATASALVYWGAKPLRIWEALAVAVCSGLGGWLAVLPFLKDHEAGLKLAELEKLSDSAAQIGHLDAVAESIAGATSQWQSVHERARDTAEKAREILDGLTREAEAFATTVSRTADGERQTLKLEVEKLRRSEGDWLQVVGRIMDHIFALHLAAVRSGQATVVGQVERFHGACRDIVRRVGLVPLVAAPDEAFDPRRHQVVDGAPPPPPGARIEETVAPGYLFQGRLLRPVIVRMVESGSDAAGHAPEVLTASRTDSESGVTPEIRGGDEPAPDEAAGGAPVGSA